MVSRDRNPSQDYLAGFKNHPIIYEAEAGGKQAWHCLALFGRQTARAHLSASCDANSAHDALQAIRDFVYAQIRTLLRPWQGELLP